ncbi:hypothetical protein L484_017934 [Morus notabilis]|uniref:Uncharacterized protein n=1 Tax=Morus notabilis TaxID=981085 RepID=W9R229_9ROSA|nr:hypothetical protein L484_017934 [Morus notabilis]
MQFLAIFNHPKKDSIARTISINVIEGPITQKLDLESQNREFQRKPSTDRRAQRNPDAKET